MGERKHKAANEKKDNVKPGIKTNNQVTHPILQLQQLVGNKAVTNMIQRQQQQQSGGYFDNSDDPGGAPTNMPSELSIRLNSPRPFTPMRLAGMEQEYFGRDEVEAQIARNRRGRQQR